MHAPLLKLLLACALLGVSSLRVGPPLPAAAARVRPLTSSTPWRRAHVVLDETDAAADASKAIDEAVDKMKKSVSSVTENLATLRVGRANPSLLDRVSVEYYGAPTPLNQLASVSAPTASQLVVDVYDKSAMGDVEKALVMSDLGMTPSNDGKVRPREFEEAGGARAPHD